jgi:hypothetical protein
MQYTATRPRLCEGDRASCRNEVWLSWKDYKAARAQGRLVCSACIPNHATVHRFVPGGAVIGL